MFVGYKTISNRKNISANTQKYIKQNLQTINIYLGDKNQQIFYKGSKIDGIRNGKGRL